MWQYLWISTYTVCGGCIRLTLEKSKGWSLFLQWNVLWQKFVLRSKKQDIDVELCLTRDIGVLAFGCSVYFLLKEVMTVGWYLKEKAGEKLFDHRKGGEDSDEVHGFLERFKICSLVFVFRFTICIFSVFLWFVFYWSLHLQSTHSCSPVISMNKGILS